MSHFYSRIHGNKGPATRCGTKSSGITAMATGWDIGGIVEAEYNSELQTDTISFYHTQGSNKTNSRKLVASFAVLDGKMTLLNTNYPELFI